MNDCRTWYCFLSLAVFVSPVTTGCHAAPNPHPDRLREKAELTLAEARYLESKPIHQWTIENGVPYTAVPTFDDIRVYIPEDHAVRKRGGTDIFGNPYVLCAVKQGVAVNAKTIALCSDTVRQNPNFWGRHDERVLNLIRAAETNDIATVRALVDVVPDPNIPNLFGERALVFALAKGHTEIEKTLIAHGAVLPEGDGSPLWMAIDDQNMKAVEDLVNRFPYMATATYTSEGDDPKTSQLAIRESSKLGNTAMVRLLLEHGADPNTLDGHPLWMAVFKGHLEVVKILVEAGARITPEALSAARQPEREAIQEYLERRLSNPTDHHPDP